VENPYFLFTGVVREKHISLNAQPKRWYSILSIHMIKRGLADTSSGRSLLNIMTQSDPWNTNIKLLETTDVEAENERLRGLGYKSVQQILLERE
jgi:hypothetical protein